MSLMDEPIFMLLIMMIIAAITLTTINFFNPIDQFQWELKTYEVLRKMPKHEILGLLSNLENDYRMGYYEPSKKQELKYKIKAIKHYLSELKDK